MTTRQEAILAQRLILAQLGGDETDYQTTLNEVADEDWPGIAEYLVCEAMGFMGNDLGQDGAVDRTKNEITWLLDPPEKESTE